MVKGLPSVNPTGRGGKWKPLSDALRMELAAEPQRARRIARRLLQEAEEGNLQAAQILFDRTEGKALHLQSLRNRAEHREANQTQVAIERSAAQRDVKITLPKLKFLDEPENEL
jgi:hypothetical protein